MKNLSSTKTLATTNLSITYQKKKLINKIHTNILKYTLINFKKKINSNYKIR